MGLTDDVFIEMGPARQAIAIAAGEPELFGIEDGDGDIVPQGAAFGDDIAEGVEDHGAAVLQLIVVHADGVGKDGVDRVIVSAGGEPFHEPGAAFEAVEFDAEGGRISLATGPELGIDEARARAGGGSAHRDMRHEDDVGAEEGGCPDVLDDVIVVADEDTAFPAFEVEDDILVAGCEVRVDEGMEFAEFGDEAVGTYGHVGLV